MCANILLQLTVSIEACFLLVAYPALGEKGYTSSQNKAGFYLIQLLFEWTQLGLNITTSDQNTQEVQWL